MPFVRLRLLLATIPIEMLGVKLLTEGVALSAIDMVASPFKDEIALYKPTKVHPLGCSAFLIGADLSVAYLKL